MISAQAVKELRDKTGAGMMDCKKALTQAEGDIEKAVDILRERGLASAAKKSGRVASEGVIATFVSEDMKNAAMIELNCETDFVSSNADFINLANGIREDCCGKRCDFHRRSEGTSIRRRYRTGYRDQPDRQARRKHESEKI